MSPYKRTVMILADGSRPDVFASLADEGRLPHIKRYLIDPGALHHGVSVFPSTTGPAHLPFLTGCAPGTCNVPGIRWFDKDEFAARRWSRTRHRSYVGADTLSMNRDIRPDIKTLFDIFPRSVNIFSGINRGVSFFGNKTKFFRIWNWYYAHLTDRWSMVDRNAGRQLMKSIRHDPQFIFALYPGIDEYSHIGDPFHDATLSQYECVDNTIGQLGQFLEKKGWLDDTLIFIVSDHGLSATHTHLGVNQLLENEGIRTFFYPVVMKRDFEAASMVSGNSMLHLYFAHVKNGGPPERSDWKGIMFEENFSSKQKHAIELLKKEEAVDILITRSREGGLLIYRNGQQAKLSHVGEKIRYERLKGDPLDYGSIPEELSEDEWLQATYESDYPDAPVQLMQLIRSRRSGDVILSARSGYDLRERYEIHEHKGSHGSLHRDQMKIPIISNYPLRGPIRSVDVFATICELMGQPIPANIDGVSRV